MISYLCSTCREELRISSHLKAVNEVGRKYCRRCGSNEDTLEIFDFDQLTPLLVGDIKTRGE